MKTIVRFFALAACLLLPSIAFAAGEAVELKTATGVLHGTLVVPAAPKPAPVVLLIPGSGPTDRNGNSAVFPGQNNSLKMLADALAARGIASLRYDKRGVGESKAAVAAESELRFETSIDDAAAWAAQLSKDPRFRGVTIIGHSEGSLVGMVAAQKVPVAAFVSIAGVGRPADAVIHAQLAGKLPPDLQKFSDKALVALKSGKTVGDVPPRIMSLYRPSVQPYLISWFRYDPAVEIKKLTIPVLILQGTTDVQVGVDDAKTLAAAKPGAKLAVIEGMNHVMKDVPADRVKQAASYSDPSLPIDAHLVDAIATFVTQYGTKRK